ncbi:MAG: T9SS type A sorting domain-containing protein [candidate division Zixibacteria bacterium]|nr:T9SS type A sorting domain-containing protein [candidate division Zixibacteria bacterium]
MIEMKTVLLKRLDNMKAFRLLLAIVAAVFLAGSAGAQRGYDGKLILDEQDGYEISFGSINEGYLGQQNLIIPIWITNEDPVEYIHLELEYDPSLIQPTVVAPALFYQYFNYSSNYSGRISIELECNLFPPPDVPPIGPGSTIIAYIMMDVMVNDLERDVYTEILFFEDINTPFPDNFIMLENDWFVVPPQLMLTQGTVLIYNPLYGDINLNTLPYEVGDVITFISHLGGQIEFSCRQMANSDCNRDGVQATISDLVYMLNVINGMPDTLNVVPPGYSDPDYLSLALSSFKTAPTKTLDNNFILCILAEVEEPLGGFAFTLQTSDFVSQFGEATLGRDVENFLVASTVTDGMIKIAGCARNPMEVPSGNLELIRIPIKSNNRLDIDDFSILSYDFSDGLGNMIDVDYKIQLERPTRNDEQDEIGKVSVSPVAYPNPFNSQVLISFAPSQPGQVSIEIFDILGRKVKTLKDSFEQPGQQQITWYGVNEGGNKVSAGIYLCRIKLDEEEKVVKLQYLK